MTEIELKKCKRCKKEGPVTEFYSNSRCQACKDYYDEYYKTHKEQEIKRALKHINKDRVKTNKYKRELMRRNPVGYMLQRIRSRSNVEGIPFNLTKEDIVIPDTCPILGIPLQINNDHVGPNSTSLDRIIPELGYVKGNVAVISHRANSIKNNASIEELEKVLEWLKSQNTTSK